MDMKERSVAYLRPASYQAIYLSRNTGLGVMFGGLSLCVRFCHDLAYLVVSYCSRLGNGDGIIVRSFDDDNEYCLSAAEVELIEDSRFRLMTDAKQTLNNSRIMPSTTCLSE